MLIKQDLSRGFTMVEVVVVLAILGFLLMAAVPSYSTYVANSNLRNTAELFYSAVQKARAEAIRRNDVVELVLTADALPLSSAVKESKDGTGWVLRAPNASVAAKLIDSKTAAEAGGGSITVNAEEAIIKFNGIGETTNDSTIQVAFKHATLNTGCDLAQGVRCLNVRISSGGQARLCEPNQPSTDNRAC